MNKKQIQKIMKEMKMNNKGNIFNAVTLGGSALVVLALFILVVSLITSFGSDLLTDQRADQTAGSFAFNATTEGLEAMTDVASEQTTFSSVGVIGVVIAIIIAVFGGLVMGKGLAQ